KVFSSQTSRSRGDNAVVQVVSFFVRGGGRFLLVQVAPLCLPWSEEGSELGAVRRPQPKWTKWRVASGKQERSSGAEKKTVVSNTEFIEKLPGLRIKTRQSRRSRRALFWLRSKVAPWHFLR